MAAENRLYVRYSLQGMILIQETGSIKTLKGELVDLSFKGCAAYCKQPLKLENGVKFIVKTEELGVHFQGTAQVKYCQPIVRNSETLYRIGIEFVGVDSEQVRDALLHLQKRVEGNGA